MDEKSKRMGEENPWEIEVTQAKNYKLTTYAFSIIIDNDSFKIFLLLSSNDPNKLSYIRKF